jgi:HEAT repeat protein
VTGLAPRLAARAAVAVLAVLVVARAPALAADDPLDPWRKGLKAPAPEARAEAAKLVARAARGLSADDRKRAALLLRDALKGEPEDATRAEVVRALAALDDPTAWIAVLVAAAGDRGEAARAEAARAVLLARGGMLAAADRLRREDDDPTFRATLYLLLGRRRRPDAVPLLLEALADPHPRAATAAAEALEAISGQALGYGPVAWREWWAKASAVPAKPPDPEPITREPEAPALPPPPPPARGLAPPFYGLPLGAKDVVFVLDVSGSVGASGLENVKGELLRAVERLSSDVHVAALFFDEAVRAWHPETVPATPEMKEDLARFVRGIPRGQRTDVMTPLNAGLQIVRNRVKARLEAKEPPGEPVTMVVVSDGRENERATPGEAVGDKLDRLDFAHAVVHAVVVGGKDNGLMAALARRGGGRYLVVP